MKLLVYGAGVTGSLFSARLYEAGHDISLLARGERLASLRQHGVQLAKEDSPTVRRVPVPVVENPDGGYDLTAVFVRTHQVDAVVETLARVEGDVLFMLNWAAGAEPLGAVIGHERVLLGFPTAAGTMDGDVVRYRAPTFMTRMSQYRSANPTAVPPRVLNGSRRRSAPPESRPRRSRRWTYGLRHTPPSRCHSDRRRTRLAARQRWQIIRTRSAT